MCCCGCAMYLELQRRVLEAQHVASIDAAPRMDTRVAPNQGRVRHRGGILHSTVLNVLDWLDRLFHARPEVSR